MAVALVTGGGRGIGRVIARALTAEGWTVVVTGRTASLLDEAVAAGDAALAVPGDASDPSAVAAAVVAAEVLGPLDLVVANAGVFRAAGPIWQTDPEQWWADLTINLRGPVLLLQSVLGTMVARGAGRIIVMGSGLATDPLPWASVYSTSKAAVLRLVDSVAGELHGTGVSVFAISPGLVATDMTDFPESFLTHYPAMRDSAQIEGRPPEECAALVLRLAAGGYDDLSGRYVHVRDDLDAAVAVARSADAPGTLRLVGYGS
jgi:NAD(P)-dependent dehydrogenase (short-subunit alcohol dehydrogenase family)